MRVIIAGGRDFNDYGLLFHKTHEIFKQLSDEKHLTGRVDIDINNIEIVSGTARGADQLGEKFAKEHEIRIKRFPADWNTFGKRAGYIRNEQMTKYAKEDKKLGVLIAFWNGESRCTKHMIDLANKHELRVFVVNY
ncbi:DUF2493 domain-containing protein [Tissierella praeacuta]|uniref:DUF2493 domain-containing protein n=1 Tax=Tissierella praeacuta TaxID=43131 RepID=UPI003DA2E72C